jgi:cytosine/adenosine deaminase-related metal-dependent hydrolase
MIVVRAAWICPITRPPIENAWIAIDGDRIVGFGSDPRDAPPVPVRDLGQVAVLPGLVNAHTHLELSWLRGRVPPADTFVHWIKQLFVARGGRHERPDDPDVLDAARRAVRELRACGIAAVGDISNSLATVAPLRDEGLRGVIFHELLGFNLPHGRRIDDTRAAREAAQLVGQDEVRVSIAPHACYSVSPEMFRAIRTELDAASLAVTSVHVGESDSEMEFLERGTGAWPDVLRWVGSWVEGWQPPGCGPVEFLDALRFLDARTLVVHGVQLSDDSLAALARIGCTLVTCPRSNIWVGAGAPPIARFYASGVPVAIGTDSLASVDDLNVFAELATIRSLAPDVPARALLQSATLIGARALGFDGALGSIDEGKVAALIAVELPTPLDDVEEYLVGGVGPGQVKWVVEAGAARTAGAAGTAGGEGSAG